MSDPKRLLDDPRADSFGSALLERALEPGPTDAQVDALWAALATRLPGGGTAGTPSDASGASAGAAAKGAGLEAITKAVTLLAVAGAATAAIATAFPHAFWHRSAEPRSLGNISSPAAAEARPEPAVQPPAPEAATSADGLASASPASAPGPASAPATRAVLPPPGSRAHAVASTKATSLQTNSLQAETALVLLAHQALRAGDCAGALGTLEQAQARFANGSLVEEREALAIEALACLGRREEAADRTEAFLRAYPATLHAATVRRFAR